VRVLGLPGGKPTFCLTGDSHAAALATGLDVVAREHKQTGLFIMKAMHPYIHEGTRTVDQEILHWLAARPDIQDIYIVGRWINMVRIRDGLPALGMRGRIEPVVLKISLRPWNRISGNRPTVFKTGQTRLCFYSVPDYDIRPPTSLHGAGLFQLP
jgi:hypothetical protein